LIQPINRPSGRVRWTMDMIGPVAGAVQADRADRAARRIRRCR
jgi:hypothetical protein